MTDPAFAIKQKVENLLALQIDNPAQAVFVDRSGAR